MFESIYPTLKARMLLSKNLPQPAKKITFTQRNFMISHQVDWRTNWVSSFYLEPG